VPAAFTVLDDVGRLAWRLFSRFVGEADEKPAHPKPATPPRARPAKDVTVPAE